VGLSEGGIIEFVLHELEIDCPAAAVPEKLVVNINDLHLEQAIHARDIALPPGATLVDDSELLVVHCITPHVVEEVSPAAVTEPGAAEPELIRKEKPSEEEEGESPAKEKKEK